MSISVTGRVWSDAPSDLSSTDLLVLLALADEVRGSEGPFCWPSMEFLARKAHCSKRTMVSTIARLVAAKEIVEVDWRLVPEAIRRRGKWGRSNLYAILTGLRAEERQQVLSTMYPHDGATAAPSAPRDGEADGEADGATDGANPALESMEPGEPGIHENPLSSSSYQNMGDGAKSAPSAPTVRGLRKARRTRLRDGSGELWQAALPERGEGIALTHFTSGSARTVYVDGDLAGYQMA